MFGTYFGKYLESKGILTNEQYTELILADQNKRVKMGLLAVESGLMTMKQADEVNRLQQVQDRRFGDIAVEKGYLTEEQVGELLKKQGDGYLLFVQTLVDNQILTLDEIQKELKAYQEEEQFTDEDLDAMKSCDIDRIVPVLIRESKVTPFITDYIALVMRNMVRFIDRNFRMGHIERINGYVASFFAGQELVGDYQVLTGFSGTDLGIKRIAEIYAKEEFSKVDMDVLDAISEFLNCNNGLFATKLSHQDVELDMCPPIMQDTQITIQAEGNMFKLPLFINDQQVDLIIRLL